MFSDFLTGNNPYQKELFNKSKRQFDHLSDKYKNDVLRKRPITQQLVEFLSIIRKETDFANLIKGNT